MAASFPSPGQTLGHYRLVEQIDAGGMGLVFRAHNEHLDRDVALKVLTPGTLTDDNARKRFRKEALTLSQLNHPNIETVHDFDTQDASGCLRPGNTSHRRSDFPPSHGSCLPVSLVRRSSYTCAGPPRRMSCRTL